MSERTVLDEVGEVLLRELGWEETQLDSMRDRGHRIATLALGLAAALSAVLAMVDETPHIVALGIALGAAFCLLLAAALGGFLQGSSQRDRVDIADIETNYLTAEAAQKPASYAQRRICSNLVEVLMDYRESGSGMAKRLQKAVVAMIAGAGLGVVALSVAWIEVIYG